MVIFGKLFHCDLPLSHRVQPRQSTTGRRNPTRGINTKTWESTLMTFQA